MNIFLLLLCLGSALLPVCTAFVQSSSSRRVVSVTSRPNENGRNSPLVLQAADYDDVADIGYGVSVQKPMGVVFGENREPFYGLVVDDISEGLNGAQAGLRVGDQLLAVNGNVVVGKNFDTVMGQLADGPSRLDLILYRGPVSTLFTILSNRIGDDEGVVEDDDDEGEEPVIMDENYVSPVQIEVKEQKPLTPGDFFKAMKKVGSMLTEDVVAAPTGEEGDTPKQEKKKGGFFGFGGEAIQLDGDEAKGLK